MASDAWDTALSTQWAPVDDFYNCACKNNLSREAAVTKNSRKPGIMDLTFFLCFPVTLYVVF